ncbi:MAG TPA: hypothetical protein QGG93_00785, partial [Verrucomicrobiota bacterium]|nr:hypothetical protein [Verrucomicrobiota bacterium]
MGRLFLRSTHGLFIFWGAAKNRMRVACTFPKAAIIANRRESCILPLVTLKQEVSNPARLLLGRRQFLVNSGMGL